MKILFACALSSLLLTACDTRVNTGPPETKVEKNTTIVNPEKKVEKTTVVNPPAEEKKTTTTTTETKK